MTDRHPLPRAPDNLETKILKELTDPASDRTAIRESYTGLANRIGANKETVRVAVKRATKSRLVEKWRMLLNPNILEQEFAGIQLEISASEKQKPNVIFKIELIEGVSIIFDYLGRSLRIVFYYDSEQSAQRKLRLIAAICGCEMSNLTWWRVIAPRCTLKLRRTDWLVLKLMSKDPRRPSSEIARELDISTRSVNRRIKKMTESNVMYLIPVRNIKNSLGVLCSYLIKCTEKTKGEIDRMVQSRYGRRIDFALQNAKGISLLTLLFDNISEAEEFKQDLEKMDGVDQVSMNLLKEFIFVDSWLDEVLLKHVT